MLRHAKIEAVIKLFHELAIRTGAKLRDGGPSLWLEDQDSRSGGTHEPFVHPILREVLVLVGKSLLEQGARRLNVPGGTDSHDLPARVARPIHVFQHMRGIDIIEGPRLEWQRLHICGKQSSRLGHDQRIAMSIPTLIQVEIHHIGGTLEWIVSRSDVKNTPSEIRSLPEGQLFHSEGSSSRNT